MLLAYGPPPYMQVSCTLLVLESLDLLDEARM